MVISIDYKEFIVKSKEIEEKTLNDLKKKIISAENGKAIAFLGAPRVGQTELILRMLTKESELDNFLIITSAQEFDDLQKRAIDKKLPEKILIKIDNIDNLPDGKVDYLILDDFYRIFCEFTKIYKNNEIRNRIEKINELITNSKKVIFVTTPYRFDWLIRLKRNIKKVDIPKDLANLLNNIVNQNLKIIAYSVNLPFKAKPRYEYTFKHLKDKKLGLFGIKYESHIPYENLVVGISAIFSENTFRSIYEHTEVFSFEVVATKMSKTLRELVPLLGDISAIGIFALLIFAFLRINGSHERELKIFYNQQNLRNKLERCSIACLEKMDEKLKLPPLSFEEIRKNLASDRMDDIIRKLEGKFTKKLEELRNEICYKILNSYTREIEGQSDEDFIKKVIATRKYQNVEPEDVVEEGLEDIISEAIMNSDDKVVIITGAPGKGKSILMYLIWKKLKELGYTARQIKKDSTLWDEHSLLEMKLLYDDLMYEIDSTIYRSILGKKDIIMTCSTEEYKKIREEMERDVRINDPESFENSVHVINLDDKITENEFFKKILVKQLNKRRIKWSEDDENIINVIIEKSEYLPAYLTEFVYDLEEGSELRAVNLDEIPRGITELFVLRAYRYFMLYENNLHTAPSVGALIALSKTDTLKMEKHMFNKIREMIYEIYRYENVSAQDEIPHSVISQDRYTVYFSYNYWEDALNPEKIIKDIEKDPRLSKENRDRIIKFSNLLKDIDDRVMRRYGSWKKLMKEAADSIFDHLKENRYYSEYGMLGALSIINNDSGCVNSVPKEFLDVLLENRENIDTEVLLYCSIAYFISGNRFALQEEAWNNRGNVLDELGRYEEALESYDRAIKINENHAEAWILKSFVLCKINRFNEALEAINKAKEIAEKTGDTELLEIIIQILPLFKDKKCDIP